MVFVCIIVILAWHQRLTNRFARNRSFEEENRVSSFDSAIYVRRQTGWRLAHFLRYVSNALAMITSLSRSMSRLDAYARDATDSFCIGATFLDQSTNVSRAIDILTRAIFLISQPKGYLLEYNVFVEKFRFR